MQTVRRRISIVLLAMTLLSLLPGAGASAAPRGLAAPSAEPRLAPLAPAGPRQRPAEARSTIAPATSAETAANVVVTNESWPQRLGSATGNAVAPAGQSFQLPFSEGWEKPTEWIQSNPIIIGSNIYATEDNPQNPNAPFLKAYALETGTLVWQVTLSGKPLDFGEGLIGTSDTVFLYSNVGGTQSTDTRLTAYNAATGAQRWSVQLGTSNPRGFVYDNGVLYATSAATISSPAVMTAYNATTGAQIWQTAAGTLGSTARIGAPIVMGTTIFVCAEKAIKALKTDGTAASFSISGSCNNWNDDLVGHSGLNRLYSINDDAFANTATIETFDATTGAKLGSRTYSNVAMMWNMVVTQVTGATEPQVYVIGTEESTSRLYTFTKDLVEVSATEVPMLSLTGGGPSSAANDMLIYTTNDPGTQTPTIVGLDLRTGQVRSEYVLPAAPDELMEVEAAPALANGYIVVAVNETNFGEEATLVVLRADGQGRLPEDRQPGRCLCEQASDTTPLYGDPVDPDTLSYESSATDMTVPAAGPPLAFSRTYISMFADPAKYPVGVLGPGWKHAYEVQLTFAGSVGGEAGTIIYEAMGGRLRFSATGTTETGPTGMPRTVYPASQGVYARLTRDSGSANYVLTNRDQSWQVFNASGKLIEQYDVQGRRQALTYYNSPGQIEHGQLQEVRDMISGRTLRFNYGRATFENGQTSRVYLREVSNPEYQKITFSYFSTGTRLLPLYQVFVPGHSIARWTYDYDTDGTLGGNGYLLTYVKHGSNDVVTNAYVNGRILKQIDGRGMLTTYVKSSTATNDITTIKTSTPNGLVVYDTIQYVYRKNGTLERVIQDNQDQGGAGFDSVSLAPSQQVDANGNTTDITNNSAGKPTKIVADNGATTDITYNSKNLPTKIVGADGVTILREYDANNNMTKQVRYPTVNPTVILTSYYTYTAGMRLLDLAQDEQGLITKYTYNPITDQVTDVTVGYGTPLATTTHTAYDFLGRPTDVTEAYGTPLATTTRTEYNHDHMLTKVIRNFQGTGVYNPLYPDRNVWTEYGYNVKGQPIWTREVDGRYSSFTFYRSTGDIEWIVKNPVDANGTPMLPVTATPPAFNPARPDANVATLYQYNQLGLLVQTTQTGILTGTFNTTTRQFSAATTINTRIEYDNLNRPVTTTLNYRPGESVTAERNIKTYTYYDAVGNVTWQSDALGRWTKTEYDELNRVKLTIKNYENGQPLTIDAANASWASAEDTDIITYNGYNALGQLQYRTDNYVDGAPAASQNPDGSWTITEVETDRVTLYSYDGLGRAIGTHPNFLAKPTVTNGKYTTNIHYAANGRVASTSDLLGQWHAPVYDALGRTTHTIQNCRSGAGTPTLAGAGSCSTQTTDRNVRTDISYFDALGRVYETKDVLNVVSRTNFDGLGRAIEQIANYKSGVTPTADTNVKTTTTYLDGLGRAWKVTDPTNRVTSYQANALGQTITITDSAGLVTRIGYDSTGQERWKRTPAGVFTVSQVDGLGRSIVSIYNYENGTVDAADGTVRDLTTRFKFDAAGRTVETTNANGEVTRFRYDMRDLLVEVIEGVKTTCPTYSTGNVDCNLVTRYTYDRAGNQKTMTNARNYTRTMSYGTRNELLSTVNENQTLTDNRVYDRAGRLTRTDINGNVSVVTYTYDELSRQKTRNGQTWTYDAGGRMLTFYDSSAVASGKTGTLGYSYDGLNRVSQTQASLDGDPTAGLFTYTYDAAGRVTKADATNYEYDSAGRPTWVKWGTGLLTEQTYDSVGRPSALKRYSGAAVEATTTTTYDAAQRVAGIKTVKTSTAATLADFTYTYDRMNRTKSLNEQILNSAGGTDTVNHTYAYDLVGRLIEEGTSTTSGASTELTTDRYGYDAVGNRTGIWNMKGSQIQSRTYNAANQVTNSGWVYDAAGRLANDGSSAYFYDDFDRLYRVIKGGVTTTMTYHGEQMLAKYVNNARTFGYVHNTVTGPYSTLQRVYDFQTPGYAVINNYYFYDLNGTPLYVYENNGTVATQRMLLTDQMKTVRATRVLNSTTPQRLGSDAWGVATTAQQGYLRFNGEFSDTGLGLVYLRARWYNPANSTFLSRDPFAGRASQPASLHQYQYAWNAPTVYSDPSGRDPGKEQKDGRTPDYVDEFKDEIFNNICKEVYPILTIGRVDVTFTSLKIDNSALAYDVAKGIDNAFKTHNLITVTAADNSSWNVGGSAKVGGSAGVPLVAEGKVEFGVTVNYTWGNSTSTTSSGAVVAFGAGFPATMSQVAADLPGVGSTFKSVTPYLVEYDVKGAWLSFAPQGGKYSTLSFGYQYCRSTCSILPGGGLPQTARFGPTKVPFFPATKNGGELTAMQVQSIKTAFGVSITNAGPARIIQEKCSYSLGALDTQFSRNAQQTSCVHLGK